MNTNSLGITSLACLAVLASAGSQAPAGPIADVVCYCEIGQNATGGINWMDPDNVLVADGNGISLGNWTDATGLPSTVEDMTGYDMDQGNPPGFVVGFSASVNNGDGYDLRIQGNAMAVEGQEYYWSEPGYVEVAPETTPGQLGATADGWADETFYLIKPSNYDEVGDPRDGPLTGVYGYMDDPSGALDDYGNPIQIGYYPGSWGEDWIAAGGSQLDLYGYADWNPAGDVFDISDASDTNGDPVELTDIAYVRIRTVSDDDMGTFGTMSTEITYVEDISVPEPASAVLLTCGAVTLLLRRRAILRS